MSEFNKALIIFFVGLCIVLGIFYGIYCKLADLEQEKANRETAEACRIIVEHHKVKLSGVENE